MNEKKIKDTLGRCERIKNWIEKLNESCCLADHLRSVAVAKVAKEMQLEIWHIEKFLKDLLDDEEETASKTENRGS